MEEESKKLCSCGKKKYDWQDVCWQCKDRQEAEKIWEYSKENKEVTNEDKVICPYCGNHYGEDDLYDTSYELECPECEETFKLEIEYSPSYSTYQIKKNED